MFSTLAEYRKESSRITSAWSRAFVESGLLANLPPIPGAQEGIKALKNAGFRLETVTSRPEIMRELTEASLGIYFPDMFHNMHFTGPPGPVLKGAVCKELGVRVLIDDS